MNQMNLPRLSIPTIQKKIKERFDNINNTYGSLEEVKKINGSEDKEALRRIGQPPP
jgi:hypothetical protein